MPGDLDFFFWTASVQNFIKNDEFVDSLSLFLQQSIKNALCDFNP